MNYGKEGYKGVTETWNIVQHEVCNERIIQENTNSIHIGNEKKTNQLIHIITYLYFQLQLKCCGAQEYKDWTNTTFSESSNSVPDSCCLSDVEGCGNGILVKPDEEVSIFGNSQIINFCSLNNNKP